MLYLWLTWLVSPLLRLLAGRAPALPQRILVIQMAKIGDLLCATPVFREIRRSYPSVHLSVMATRQNAELLRVNPHVNEVVQAAGSDFRGLSGKVRLVRLLHRGRYDCVLHLNAGTAYAVASLWALIPLRFAVQSNFGGASHRLAARLWTAVEKHRGERLIQETYLALLERMGVVGGCVDKEAFAVAGAEARVDAVLGLSREPMLIGIGVSSANRLKALGSVKIEAIAGQLLLAQPGARIVLVGSHEDSAQAALMVRALPHGSVITACGALSLAELPALLKRLALFVGVDSGITYMADAVGTPVVSVAGPCNMLETRPLGRAVVILQRDDLPCAPCAHIFNAPYTCRVGTRACVEEIPAGEIVAAALAMLRRHSDGKAQC